VLDIKGFGSYHGFQHQNLASESSILRVDDELSKSLNRRLGINLCLLARVHMYQAAEEELISAQKKKKRKRMGSSFAPSLLYDSSSSSKINGTFLQEARRYMKYATAVYGQAMMNAAEVDATGRLDGKVGRVSRETISTHISVPAEDIVSMDISNLDGDSNHLRHMVVVDHEHKKVVLSIRGTFSLEEIVVDVAAFSREFCGGEAHSEVATMAERVWTVAGPKVQTVLEENPGYELILTGHSLGAGAACLVTILVQNKRLLPKDQKIRCFAYASPPVFTPLEFAPKSVESTTNFVSFRSHHLGEKHHICIHLTTVFPHLSHLFRTRRSTKTTSSRSCPSKKFGSYFQAFTPWISTPTLTCRRKNDTR
jgi:hypothetical protein